MKRNMKVEETWFNCIYNPSPIKRTIFALSVASMCPFLSQRAIWWECNRVSTRRNRGGRRYLKDRGDRVKNLSFKGEASADLVARLAQILGIERCTQAERYAGAKEDVVCQSGDATV